MDRRKLVVALVGAVGVVAAPKAVYSAIFLATTMISLAVLYIGLYGRVLRASLIEASEEDYIRTARSKGLPEGRVLVRHALRNAAVSTVSVLGVNIGYLVGGTLVIEQVYALPGVGQLMINSIFQRDFPVVQAVTLLIAGIVMVLNIIADVLYTRLDPRIRTEARA